MRSKREPGVQIKTQAQLAKMAEAGRAVASALHAAADAVAPGVTTADLDAIARAQIAAAGAAPSFLGYHGYPATIWARAMASRSAVVTPWRPACLCHLR